MLPILRRVARTAANWLRSAGDFLLPHRPFLLLLIAVEVMYNSHALIPSNVVSNEMRGTLQYVVVDLSKPSPHAEQRFAINLAFGVIFLVLWVGSLVLCRRVEDQVAARQASETTATP